MEGWIPKKDILVEQIQEEILKLRAKRIPQYNPTPLTTITQEFPLIMPDWTQPTPVVQNNMPTWAQAPQTFNEPIQPVVAPRPAPQPVVSPVLTPKVEEFKPEGIPFWQRALQVFSAPFDWVDENVIKPGLSTVGTTAGIIPELPREQGEDFFKWKTRSWEAWQTPGVDIKVPWSDNPMTLDIKGIIAFAPWLLLPGAGAVGQGVRGGIGVAGWLGSGAGIFKELSAAQKVLKGARTLTELEKASQIVSEASSGARAFTKTASLLGTAVEYSPWGLVEKTAGAALKVGIKGVLGAGEKISTYVGEKVFGKIPQKEIPPVVKEFTDFVHEIVVPARQAFEKEIPALRAKQAAAIDKIRARYKSGEITAIEANRLEKVATAGEIKSLFPAVPTKEITPDKIEELMGMVQKATESGFVERDTNAAMFDLLTTGTLPEPRHLRNMAKVFGDEFAVAIKSLRGVQPSKLEKLWDVMNIGRATLASTDISGVARQGLILGLMHPLQVPRAFGRMFKSLFSEKLALQMDDVMRLDPLFQEFTRKGYIAPIRKGVRLTVMEEAYMSNLAGKIPLVRRSERAYITYLNELRFGSYKVARGSWVAQGAGRKELEVLQDLINFASGRGTLPANMEYYAPMFNAFLFSPRLQMSMIQLPRQIGRMLMSKNPYMRKEAARALVTFVGGGAALLTLLKGTGAAKVELDPRSGDFAKLQIGETRYDVWRGYAQYTRFLSQMLTGERKSAYGNMNKSQRDEIAWRFLQSKSSPAFGLMIDLLRGESYLGDELFTNTNDLIKTAKERFMPLAIQDTIDAVEQSGVNGAWTAIPASLGIGTLTYINDFTRAKNKVAKSMGYGNWDEIDPKTQKRLENSNAELQAAYIAFDRQVMGTAWGDWRGAGTAVEDVFKENIDKAVAQYRATGDGYTFREKVNESFTARRGGYAARSKEGRFEDIVKRLNTQDTTEALVGLGVEQLAIRAYNDALYGDDMYDEFGDYKFDEVDGRRQALKSQLGTEMFNYVEEYRGLKYEDLPPEYQELVKAKQVLKPYWAVKGEVEKILGKPKSKYQQALFDRTVGRIHKQKKAANTEMAKYYNMFYTRVS